MNLQEEQQLNKINKIMNINEDAFNFSKNTSLLREIDEEFKTLLDSYNYDKSDFDLIDKSEINKIATNISKITKKLFNTNMKLKFIEADPKGKDKFRVDSVASTMIYPEQIRNTVDGISKIVIEEKNGIYYSKPREIEVFMELSSIRYFLEMKKNSKKVAFSNFNERVCTSVLLHEIGHNLFLPIEIKVITQGKEPAFELKYKDNKPVQFQYTKDIEADTDRNLKLAGPMIISMTIMVAILTSLTGVASITGITSIFSFFKLGSMDNKRVKKMNYNLSERSANQLPALYGYAKENIVLYDIVYAATNSKMEKTKNNIFSKIFRGLMYPGRLFIRNYKDYTADSIDSTIKTLKFEINNPNNSKEVKEGLKQQLSDIQTLMKKSDNM
ncbi:hypothetical protein CPT_Madawaska_068 [Staphylococcus phage Madawaska]|nr:hypothetical protein CPT_Madawaska_068 [Staphylococcus phage Madawaska]